MSTFFFPPIPDVEISSTIRESAEWNSVESVRMQQVNQIVDSFLGHIPISTPQLENLTVQALQTLLRGSIFSVDDSTPKPLIQEECNRAGRGRIFFYSCIVSVHNVYLNAILLVKQIQNRTTSLNRIIEHAWLLRTMAWRVLSARPIGPKTYRRWIANASNSFSIVFRNLSQSILVVDGRI